MAKKKKMEWPKDLAHVDNVREEIAHLVEELCKLHDMTDPRHGELSEKDKHAHAHLAVVVWWQLYARLMLWVQSHFIGYEMARSTPTLVEKLMEVRQGDITEDVHQLEMVGAAYAVNSTMNRHMDEDLEKAFDKLDLDLNDTHLRRVIVSLILSTSADSSVWRFPLTHALRALNAGEQVEFVKPAKSRRRGRPFALDETRALAISHVHYLSGKGIKKHIALARVAHEIAVSPETLRDWEKQLKADNWYTFQWESAWIAGQIEDNMELANADVFDARYYGRTDSIQSAKMFLDGQLGGRNLEPVKKRLRELHQKDGA